MKERIATGITIGVCVILMGLLVVFGIPLTNGEGKTMKVVYGEEGLSAGIVEKHMTQDELRVMVKGSIYETGEAVAVYGTCLNSTDDGFPNSYGMLSAWYPNGTQAFINASMVELQTGYFSYIASMLPVQGTYLTEFTCYINGTDLHAKAFGEWQNPRWVERIGNISVDIANLSNNTENWFNITWTKIDSINMSFNSTFANITDQLNYIAMVANNSVDRNDSYLASLLQDIAAAVGAPVTHNLTTVIVADTPVINKNWNIDVTAYNEYNVTVGSPLVSCFLNTTNIPPSVNQQMDAKKRLNDDPYFSWTEKVKSTNFAFTVQCVYN